MGDVPFYAKIWPKLTHPLSKRQFLIYFRRSASAVTLSEKKTQLTLIGSPLGYVLSSEPNKMNSVRCPCSKTQNDRFMCKIALRLKKSTDFFNKVSLLLGTAARLISAFTKFEEFSICIANYTM